MKCLIYNKADNNIPLIDLHAFFKPYNTNWVMGVLCMDKLWNPKRDKSKARLFVWQKEPGF